ncbi:hypothetical protein [Chryseobacterium daeguense]|uniref:hypothetical protein n=1 Tax=Chryseobacterium daeguense TaxID=412438 RepID=UPI0004183D18|nr:hypothetical protein [Chryseobacterium daeguense]
MNNLEYAKQQLNRFYLDIIESQRLNPSYPFIQSYSETLLNLISYLRENDKVMSNKLLSLWMDADIFKADIPGELHDDYKKRNKRYRENWLKQKKKIDTITSELFDYLNEIPDLQ